MDSVEATQAPDVASLEGVVSDDNFIPVQGAQIRLVEMGLETKTLWNGKFSFPQVPPDSYTLTVKAAGWKSFQEVVVLHAGRAYSITVFLEPFVGQVLAPEVKLVRGSINCVYIDVGVLNTQAACNNVRYQLAFPKDWAALVAETTWNGGASTSQQAILSLLQEDAQAVTGARPYARVTSGDPAKIALLPGVVHTQYAGEVATPAKGEKGPLTLDVRKAPTTLGPVGAAVTVQEAFETYVSTFYYDAPSALDDYSALPD